MRAETFLRQVEQNLLDLEFPTLAAYPKPSLQASLDQFMSGEASEDTKHWANSAPDHLDVEEIREAIISLFPVLLDLAITMHYHYTTQLQATLIALRDSGAIDNPNLRTESLWLGELDL